MGLESSPRCRGQGSSLPVSPPQTQSRACRGPRLHLRTATGRPGASRPPSPLSGKRVEQKQFPERQLRRLGVSAVREKVGCFTEVQESRGQLPMWKRGEAMLFASPLSAGVVCFAVQKTSDREAGASQRAPTTAAFRSQHKGVRAQYLVASVASCRIARPGDQQSVIVD